jgi:hypothetical protein
MSGMRTLTASHGVLEPLVAGHAREMFAVLSDPAICEFENSPPASEAWLRQRYERNVAGRGYRHGWPGHPAVVHVKTVDEVRVLFGHDQGRLASIVTLIGCFPPEGTISVRTSRS